MSLATLSNGSPAATCDQSEDFIVFTLDGAPIEVDLYAAAERLAGIDRAHTDDPAECLACRHRFILTASDGRDLACPKCNSATVQPPQAFLDDVAAYIKSLGAARCGRRAAGMFYQAVTGRLESLKKTTAPTPESLSGTGSILLAGEADGDTPT